MATLPLLRTGAVMQYPAVKETRFATGIVRFLDGSEQRYRDYARPLRRWVVRLDLLDEAELAALEDFFVEQDGPFESFAFVDPADGQAYPDCSLEGDEMETEFAGELRGGTKFTIRENRT